MLDDIKDNIKGRRQADTRFTTMIDLYALPGDFPGKSQAVRNPADPTPYVEGLEAALAAEIEEPRFTPHIQLHEYETLLFADLGAMEFSNLPGWRDAAQSLKQATAEFPGPEHINDGAATAPSKRIIAALPGYASLKRVAGPDIADHIGIPTLRQKCPHFGGWITRLERLWDPDPGSAS